MPDQEERSREASLSKWRRHEARREVAQHISHLSGTAERLTESLHEVGQALNEIRNEIRLLKHEQANLAEQQAHEGDGDD